jgi:MFS family permease
VSTQAILERERRYRRLAVAASILPLLLLVASSALLASGTSSSDLLPGSLRAVNEAPGSVIGGSIIGGIALAMLAIPLGYIFLAAAARSPSVRRGLLFLVLLGPLLFGLRRVLAGIASVDIAEQFAAQAENVGDIYTLSSNLVEDSGLQQAALILEQIGGLAFIFAMVYVPLWAVRTGLLTRFHGTLGMALGASFILPPLTQITLPATLAWFMYFGLLLAGRTPRGRPPAWDTGEATPPPAAGEDKLAAAGAGGGTVVEGDATEIPGVDENPNAARRERAKKRKRKRRR